jgi:ribosomal protein L11 methyltransferase
MQVICSEAHAHAIANLVVEMFDMSEAAASAFELEPHTRNWTSGDWIVEGYFAYPPDEDMIRDLVRNIADDTLAQKVEFSTISEQDWLSKASEGLDPVDAGRFIVHTRRDRDIARRNGNRIAIEIDAALAFGTGHHGTTRGCLVMLDAILKQRRPVNILDVGTGTGVLAIAAAKVLHRPIACSDIDPISVETTIENAALNNVTPWVRPVIAPGLEHPALRNKRPYDLIFANILAKPLRGLAPSIAKASTLQTEIVLSGLLSMDVPGVLSAYGAQDFSLVKRIDLEGWATLLMRNGGSGRRRFDHYSAQPGWNDFD